MRRILLSLVLIACLLPAAASAQTTVMPTVYSWTAPTTGSAVDHYNVYHKVGSAAFVMIGTSPTAQYTVPAVVGVVNIVHVAGVDAQNRVGVMSADSDPYTPDAGSPGAPGKPIRIP